MKFVCASFLRLSYKFFLYDTNFFCMIFAFFLYGRKLNKGIVFFCIIIYNRYIKEVKMDNNTIHINITNDLLDKLKDEAKKEDRSVVATARHIIKLYFDENN